MTYRKEYIYEQSKTIIRSKGSLLTRLACIFITLLFAISWVLVFEKFEKPITNFSDNSFVISFYKLNNSLYQLLQSGNFKAFVNDVRLIHMAILLIVLALFYLAFYMIIRLLTYRVYFAIYYLKRHFSKEQLIEELSSSEIHRYDAKDVRYLVKRLYKYGALDELWNKRLQIKAELGSAYDYFVKSYKDDDKRMSEIFYESNAYKTEIIDYWFDQKKDDLLWSVRNSSPKTIYPYFIANYADDEKKMRSIFFESDVYKQNIIDLWCDKKRFDLLWDIRFFGTDMLYKVLQEHYKDNEEKLKIIASELDAIDESNK
ncbi:MAG: hypothetical protein LHW49_05730 [Candidatus Cloacimonetes bacterium]|nr:hypothetical protein [Candidatus Cloacimonadota bacterium]